MSYSSLELIDCASLSSPEDSMVTSTTSASNYEIAPPGHRVPRSGRSRKRSIPRILTREEAVSLLAQRTSSLCRPITRKAARVSPRQVEFPCYGHPRYRAEAEDLPKYVPSQANATDVSVHYNTHVRNSVSKESNHLMLTRLEDVRPMQGAANDCRTYWSHSVLPAKYSSRDVSRIQGSAINVEAEAASAIDSRKWTLGIHESCPSVASYVSDGERVLERTYSIHDTPEQPSGKKPFINVTESPESQDGLSGPKCNSGGESVTTANGQAVEPDLGSALEATGRTEDFVTQLFIYRGSAHTATEHAMIAGEIGGTCQGRPLGTAGDTLLGQSFCREAEHLSYTGTNKHLQEPTYSSTRKLFTSGQAYGDVSQVSLKPGRCSFKATQNRTIPGAPFREDGYISVSTVLGNEYEEGKDGFWQKAAARQVNKFVQDAYGGTRMPSTVGAQTNCSEEEYEVDSIPRRSAAAVIREFEEKSRRDLENATVASPVRVPGHLGSAQDAPATRMSPRAVPAIVRFADPYLSSTNLDLTPENLTSSLQDPAQVSSQILLQDSPQLPRRVFSQEFVVEQQQPRRRVIFTRKSLIWLPLVLVVATLVVGTVFTRLVHDTDPAGEKLAIHQNLSLSEVTPKENNVTVGIQTDSYDVCSAPLCRRDGSYLKGLLSWNLDPCDNFHRFLCSRWKGTTQRSEGISDVPTSAYDDLSHILEERVKVLLERPNIQEELLPLQDIFRKCTNTRELDIDDWSPMLDLLCFVALEGFPFTSNSVNSSSVWKVSAEVLKTSGTETLLSVRTASHPSKNASIIVIGSPAGLAPNAADATDTKRFYNISAHAALAALKKQRQPSTQSEEVANFAAKLEALTYNHSSRAGLQAHRIGSLRTSPELSIFLTSIFSGSDSSDYIGNDTELLIESPGFLKDLLRLVQGTEKYIVLNYIGTRLMVEMSAFAPPASGRRVVESLVQSIYKKQRSLLPRWKLCVRTAERALPVLFLHASRLAYQTHFAVISIERHLSALADYLHGSLDGLVIVDEDSRVKAKKILSRSRFALFHPRWLRDKEKVSEFVNRLPRVPRGQGLRSFYVLRGHSFRESLQQDHQDSWLGSAFDTDCRYSSRIVYVPTLLFNFTLVNIEGDESFQLPHAGVRIMRCVLGMLLHGLWSESGTAHRRWWPDLASSFLKSYELCLQEYDVTGVRTFDLLEMTAAIKPVLDVYLAEKGSDIRFENFQAYGTHHLFFVYYGLGFCEEYPTDSSSVVLDKSSVGFLTNIPLWNNRVFQETFRCPVGSAMNPPRKCVAWQETEAAAPNSVRKKNESGSSATIGGQLDHN